MHYRTLILVDFGSLVRWCSLGSVGSDWLPLDAFGPLALARLPIVGLGSDRWPWFRSLALVPLVPLGSDRRPWGLWPLAPFGSIGSLGALWFPWFPWLPWSPWFPR